MDANHILCGVVILGLSLAVILQRKLLLNAHRLLRQADELMTRQAKERL